MGEDGTCPCCGLVEEDQMHLLCCINQQMETVLDSELRKLQKSLFQDGITTPVVTAFINELCRCVHKPPLAKTTIDCEKTWATVDASRTLGDEAFVRGLHHIDWAHLLRDTWIPPAMLPNGKKERRKDPMEQSISLIRGVWDVMEAVWECRNNILHGKESHLLHTFKESVTARLLEFRCGNLDMLRRCDRFIISKYSVRDVIRWPRERKKAVLDQLESLHRIHLAEIQRDNAGYQDIRSFFIRINETDSIESNNELEPASSVPRAHSSLEGVSVTLEARSLPPSAAAPLAPTC
jgi:hypothetical protein